MLAISRTGPWPIFCLVDQICPQSVPLHIAQHSQEMLILLNRECFETPLPNAAVRAVTTVIGSNMGGEKPLHPTAQITVFVWPQQQMKVIGHQAVADNAHRPSRAGAIHQPQKMAIVGVRVENTRALIATIDDVVEESAYRCACRPWHGDMNIMTATRWQTTKSRMSPFSYGITHQPIG